LFSSAHHQYDHYLPQIQYAKDRPNGYDLNRLMMTDMNNDLKKNYTAIKNELLQKGIVESVTTASSPATDIYWHSDVDNWPGKNAVKQLRWARSLYRMLII
jgi:hypothetical protein